MEEKILDTIKSMLGVSDQDTAFDNDILVNINATFSTLYQIGVGDDSHYFVLDGSETWRDIFKEVDLIDFIKLYTYMKVRLLFDPPTNASVLESLKAQINEIEYRILLQADPADYFNDSSENGGSTLSEEDINRIWEEIMGGIPSISPGSALTDEEIRNIWEEIMGSIPSVIPGNVLSDDELKNIWEEIMGSLPGIALSDDELLDIWREVMGNENVQYPNSTMSDEDVYNLWNEIMK